MHLRTNARIYVAGHRGMVGSAILRLLQARGHHQLLFRTHQELDLTNPTATDRFFAETKPELVFLAAAKVGGIQANVTHPADFLRVNQQIQLNVLEAAHRHGVKKLLFLGSSCIYPKHAPQPMREEHLLTGPLEPTNAPYAIAKISGIMLCDSYNKQHGTNFIAAMPTNLYGPGDNFDLQTSHVLPAMIRKFHQGKTTGRVELWGSGRPRRELLHVNDLAEACLHLMERFHAGGELPFVNVGVGEDLTLRELAALVQAVVGYNGPVEWNTRMPEGAPRKLLDVSRINAMGWRASTSLQDGIRQTYDWFLRSRWNT